MHQRAKLPKINEEEGGIEKKVSNPKEEDFLEEEET